VAKHHLRPVGFGGFEGEAAYSDNAAILFGDYTSGESGSAAFANYPAAPPRADSAATSG
jgi:hypothetical protein